MPYSQMWLWSCEMWFCITGGTVSMTSSPQTDESCLVRCCLPSSKGKPLFANTRDNNSNQIIYWLVLKSWTLGSDAVLFLPRTNTSVSHPSSADPGIWLINDDRILPKIILGGGVSSPPFLPCTDSLNSYPHEFQLATFLFFLVFQTKL